MGLRSGAAARPTTIAAMRSNRRTRRARILRRAGVTQRPLGPTLHRPAAATVAEAAIAPRVVTVEGALRVVMVVAVGLRAVMGEAALRLVMVAEAGALIPAEVIAAEAAMQAQVEVGIVAVEGVRTAVVVAVIRIANTLSEGS